jgi:hypothetical protein
VALDARLAAPQRARDRTCAQRDTAAAIEGVAACREPRSRQFDALYNLGMQLLNAAAATRPRPISPVRRQRAAALCGGCPQGARSFAALSAKKTAGRVRRSGRISFRFRRAGL